MAVNKYNPNTGKPLAKGETVTVKGTNTTVTEGKTGTGTTSGGSSGNSSGSSSGSGSSSSNVGVHNYNPNTGAKLSPGETVKDNATGKYITQGTPANTSSSSAPKGVSVFTGSGNLTSGSGGTDVKTLQTFLRDNGYPDLKVDGTYGPLTKAAVAQFQQTHNLTSDGIVGPQTKSAISNLQSSDTSMVGPNGDVPYKTGDPTNDAGLQAIWDYIKNNEAQGLKLNSVLNFDQATLDKFLSTAQKQIHPFYASQIEAIKADVLKAAPQILENYGSDVASKEAGFQNDLGNSRESNAGAGLAFSGGRAKSELGAVDSQNRDLASLSQTYGNKLYDLGRTAESKIGASATPSLGSLANYSANLGGSGGFTLGGSSRPYTPGGYQIGSLTNDEEAAKTARYQALLKTAGESVIAGRDYSSLFN